MLHQRGSSGNTGSAVVDWMRKDRKRWRKFVHTAPYLATYVGEDGRVKEKKRKEWTIKSQ